MKASSSSGRFVSLTEFQASDSICAALRSEAEPAAGLAALVSSGPRDDVDASSEGIELAEVVARAERKAILAALAAETDTQVEAARRLGIGERTLWTKLKKYGL